MDQSDKDWKLRQEVKLRLNVLANEIANLERFYFGKPKELPPKFIPRHKGRGRHSDKEGLTPMMKRFVQEYPKDLNATQAAIRSGFARKSAPTRGCQLLKDPKVVKALRKEYTRITKRNRIEQDQVLLEISRLAYSNILDYCSWTQDKLTLIESSQLSKSEAAAIREVTESTSPKGATTIKIKLYDKPTALTLLCKYLGLLDAPKDDEDPKETAKRIMAEMEEIDNSIPSAPQTEEERLLDKKLNKLEERIGGD